MKTNIRKLDSLTHNDTAATKLINDNFEALQKGVEDSLSRTGKTPNFMDASLDMNMNRIINIADPVDDYDLANKHYVDEQIATEALARQSADNTLQGNIDAEELARQQADNTLQGNIDAEETRAKAAEKAITDTLDTYGNIVTHNVDEFATAAQGAKADTAVQPGDLPTVNNATITLTQGGVEKGSFTTNQGSNASIELDAGGSGGIDLNIFSAMSGYVSGSAGNYYVDIDITSHFEQDDERHYLYILSLPQTTESAIGLLPYVNTNGFSLDEDLGTDNYSRSIRLYLSDGITEEPDYDVSSFAVHIIAVPLENNLVSSTGGGVIVKPDNTSSLSENIFTYSKYQVDSLLNAKQDALVSGTNIKTLNSTSLLGSGDISITVPTKTSDLNNDSGFITSSDLSGYATETWVGNQGYAVSSSLATVATTGAYSDLSGTPSLSGYQTTSNLVTSVSSASTDSQYPSAKLFYDTVGDVETLLQGLR